MTNPALSAMPEPNLAIRTGARLTLSLFAGMFVAAISSAAFGQSLQHRLESEKPGVLARDAQQEGDAARGALLFHQAYLGCAKCHAPASSGQTVVAGLGPDLAESARNASTEELVESILTPSKVIKKGFETITAELVNGRVATGLFIKESDEQLTLRDPGTGSLIALDKTEVETQRVDPASIMPFGLVNQLTSRQQFLDLVRYLTEIRDGGPERARQLQPPPSLVALTIPEYEEHLDHAGMIRDLDANAFERGKAIYERLCVNCHGTHERPGSLPTSLRFASGRFKNGSDAFAMYGTLTRGFGLMAPQAWMVPRQKYDVIHYLREAYLKDHNPSQYVPATEEYLSGLPKGDTRGPAPSTLEPWVAMDYGPSLINTYEIGSDGANFAYKGIAVRLDAGAGGISRGRAWTVFDHDTLRMAGAWTGAGFIDWNGIHFNGRHQVHPRVAGDVLIDNPTGPGWANPETGSFADDQRVLGRDGRRYGPLPRAWARFRGLYHHGDQVVVSYSVGETQVLESPGVIFLPFRRAPEKAAATTPALGEWPVFTRTFNFGPRNKDLVLLAAAREGESSLEQLGACVRFGARENEKGKPRVLQFGGANYAEAADAAPFDMAGTDFTIAARLRTTEGGTIFASTRAEGPWAPNGTTFFVRNGRLCYDIGWVGVLESRRTVTGGRWHDVVLRWTHRTGRAELFIDGKLAGQRELRPKAAGEGHVVRVGYTAEDFPEPKSFFEGDLRDVRFFRRALTDQELGKIQTTKQGLVAHWSLDPRAEDGIITDASGLGHNLAWRGAAQRASILAGLVEPSEGCSWTTSQSRLCLRIPAGDAPLRMTMWMTRQTDDIAIQNLSEAISRLDAAPDLQALTRGGPPRWPQTLTTAPVRGGDDGPFAVDVLTHPESNPWLAQMRFTGLDFYPDGDRAVVCAWDGDVWLVSGLASLDATNAEPNAGPPQLSWRRMASGLFQPLGIKIVQDQVFVTCRDQLVILRDLNGDGETDFYECFNNDHQVTEHFHEFAMGLQTDEQGNFYYAKSARHALPAVVPHHGTLLRVSADGAKTEILATGFRAANGVCLNRDGSFVVSDQEGHWTPKNRINWVVPGGFYGNMFGYHDVTDSSDEAMKLPLCWITNSFDRSPAELLWSPPDAWGPLGGSLLNLSYGNGKVFVVPFEEVAGQKQGGMCALPIPLLPTGVMRGRFHPQDRQLYACGMFAWAGNATQPGGLYRIRYTGKPMHLPKALQAHKDRIEITFTDPLDRAFAADPARYTIKTWSLRRTADYGSEHYNEKRLSIARVTVSEDGRAVALHTPDLRPTWGMEIVCHLQGIEGARCERVIHNSVFRLH